MEAQVDGTTLTLILSGQRTKLHMFSMRSKAD